MSRRATTRCLPNVSCWKPSLVNRVLLKKKDTYLAKAGAIAMIFRITQSAAVVDTCEPTWCRRRQCLRLIGKTNEFYGSGRPKRDGWTCLIKNASVGNCTSHRDINSRISAEKKMDPSTERVSIGWAQLIAILSAACGVAATIAC